MTHLRRQKIHLSRQRKAIAVDLLSHVVESFLAEKLRAPAGAVRLLGVTEREGERAAESAVNRGCM